MTLYTSLQRKLVAELGGHLFTQRVELLFTDYVKEGDLVIKVVPISSQRALVVGAVLVERGYRNTSFKCGVGDYQYCRHDPVGEAEVNNPIIVNELVTYTRPLWFYAWTPENAELPSKLVLKISLAEIPYMAGVRGTVERLIREHKEKAQLVAEV